MDRPPTKRSLLSLQYYSLPDEVGGAWGLTHEVNKRLVQRGWEVHLITCKPSDRLPDEEVIDGVHFHRVRALHSKSVFRLWLEIKKRVNRILATSNIDLVHIHNPLVGYLALKHSRLKRIAKVYHFHSSWFDEEKINRSAQKPESFFSGIWFSLKLTGILRVIRRMEKVCFKASKSILFLSEYSRNHFLKSYRMKRHRLRVIPGGVDVDMFHPLDAEQNPQALRRDLGLPEDRPILLSVRRLETRMGLENLILATAQIVERNPDLDFMVVIGGKGSLKESLQSLIEQHDLGDRVRLAGLIPRDILPAYYQAADIFVLPTTLIEGFGLATVEALATGLPALGTPVGGTVEILKSIDEILLFPGTTPEALSLRIEKFLKNPKPFEALRSRCREHAESLYSWERVVDLMEEEFGMTLGK